MELREYYFLFKRWLWLVIMGGIVCGGAAYLYSSNQPKVYRAASTLLINEGGESSNDAIIISQRLALSYVERLTNYDVLATAIDNVGVSISPDDLQARISSELIPNTQLIALRVEHESPEIASALANEIPAVFAVRNQQIQLERFANTKESLEIELAELQAEIANLETALLEENAKRRPDEAVIAQLNGGIVSLRETFSRLRQSLEDIRIAEASSLNNVVIDEPARPPQSPIRPRVMTNSLLATITGVMMAVGVVFVVTYLDDTVKSGDELERATGLSTLGGTRKLNVLRPTDSLVVAHEPRSPAAEAFRQLRTNIQYASLDKPYKTIVVTSSNANEGKTTIAANLAIALAQSGKKVILVDTDLRRPSLHQLLEVDGARGLSNLIIRGNADGSVIKGTLVSNLRLLPAGRLPPNPAELLGSQRMKDVIEWLKGQADHVIFDSPPLLAVTDAAIMSKIVDTTLFVVSMGETRLPAVQSALKQIEAIEGQIAGVVMNRIDPKLGNAYSYYYYNASYEPDDLEEGPMNWRRWWKQSALAQMFRS